VVLAVLEVLILEQLMQAVVVVEMIQTTNLGVRVAVVEAVQAAEAALFLEPQTVAAEAEVLVECMEAPYLLLAQEDQVS
jgi:hypothetical protein